MDGVVSKKQYKNSDNISHLKNKSNLKKNKDFLYRVYQLGYAYDSDDLTIGHARFDVQESSEEDVLIKKDESSFISKNKTEIESSSNSIEHNNNFFDESDKEAEYEDNTSFSFRDMPIFSNKSTLLSHYISINFIVIVSFITIILGGFLFVGTALAVKNRIEDVPKKAISSIKSAMYSLNKSDFVASSKEMNNAYDEFLFASNEMDKIGKIAIFLSQFVPGATKLSSGSHIIEAGKYLTHSAQEIQSVIPEIINDKKILSSSDESRISFLALYKLIANRMDVVYKDVKLARGHIDKVYIDDVPEEYRDTFMQVKELMPDLESSIKNSIESRDVVEELLGAKGKRTYLFLFQNNQEMRATGGFIGSYGILKINDGQIEKLVVDDIFNPDGQLIDKIVPPLPIQKISANWSLHDSNWFVDFPVSAKKAIDFYERTGGPTVDGVVAITPVMMKKFLAITGPIKLSQYNMVITSNNFMEMMQSEVEDRENYNNKNESESDEKIEEDSHEIEGKKNISKKQPKKILSDLMPIMINRLTNDKNPKNIAKLISAVTSGLRERHIIMYMTNKKAQEIIINNGWSGSVLQTDKDYLSVINTNINGFKTDGVIDEIIKHTAEIDKDGYIIDTVEIERTHKGGKTGFPWWDAVNSDYMRIYVPKGSELISVEGQTREINKERLNYDELGYKRDKDVQREEKNIYIDDETGTRIYDEYSKTVFANWVYVSPQENVNVKYKYRLPFKVNFEVDETGKFGSYAILFQKQSGSEKSTIESKIILNDDFLKIWSSQHDNKMIMKNDLNVDRYHGAVFRVR